ncbi:MAG: response regulator, partial [Ignavibacteria bacterium]|nr:response regulator [Ignavibacteria bacterium]
QNIMRRIFKSDYEIDFCESVDEYYEKYSKTIYDIMIMDISLNGLRNGLELIKEIKTLRSYTGTPIICLTAHAQTKIRHTAIESGSDLFITKPVPNSVLKDAVASLLNKNKT